MTDTVTKPKTQDEITVERPRLRKVILVNDDFARHGARVVAVSTKDVAEAKATNATDAGRSKGHPLLFTTEPEE